MPQRVFFRIDGSLSLVVCSLLGALGLWLGLPNPLVQVPLAALLYPAMLYRVGQHATSGGEAFRHCWLMGLVGASASLYWISVPVHTVGGLPWVFAALCSMLLGAYAGVYGAVFGLLAYRLRHASQPVRLVLLALGWALLEWIGGFFGSGFPWLVLAAAFVPWPLWVQGVAYVGVFVWGGLLAGLACLLADASLCLPRKGYAQFGLAVFLLALVVGAGWLHTQRLEPRIAAALEAAPVRVALVQGNIDQLQKWDARFRRTTLETYMGLSEHVGLDRIDLLVWPETAMPFDVERPAELAIFQGFANREGLSLLTGAPGYVQGLQGPDIYNRAYLFTPQSTGVGAEPPAVYEKEHLVPFGEYLPPWLNIPLLRPLLQGVGEFSVGRYTKPIIASVAGRARGETVVQTTEAAQHIALGVLVCYESIFPGLARQRVAEGAELLVNISNDAWFGSTSGPAQHLNLAVLRAVEMQRFMVRGANTGISAIIDPLGRVVAQTRLNTAVSLTGLVAPLQETSVFFYLHAWLMPFAACLFAVLYWYGVVQAKTSNKR